MRVACQRLVLLLYVLLSSNGSDSQLAPIPLLFIEHKIPVGPVLATVFFFFLPIRKLAVIPIAWAPPGHQAR